VRSKNKVVGIVGIVETKGGALSTDSCRVLVKVSRQRNHQQPVKRRELKNKRNRKFTSGILVPIKFTAASAQDLSLAIMTTFILLSGIYIQDYKF
jgi:hypothetical protein